MYENKSNNKIIFKNTLVLYMRMFITIILGLYTSRVVLNSLGFSDYGIYNVVGGLVSMLSFLNVGMTQSSHRFIAFELGKGEINSLSRTFANSVITHSTIAIVFLLFFETVGLWFVNSKMVIPHERIYSANWVFQCSILTACFSIMSVPYNACVVAHERLGQFAYISIVETMLKFFVAIGISYSPIDKLCYYAIALMLIQVFVVLIYVVYCKKQFEETRAKLQYNKKIFSNMISFAGWGCIGNMGFSLKDQLSNVFLNLFFGTVVNAARGVAGQVNGILNSFAMNFTMAMNPQITKSYAMGDVVKFRSLSITGTKISFYLLSIVTIPFIVNRQYVLNMWLGNIPKYTESMVVIILIASCIYSMSHTLSTAIAATGNMKWFQILLSGILLLELPVTYVILKFGGNPCWAISPCIVTNLCSLFLRIILINRYIPGFGYKEYCLNTIFRGSVVFVLSLTISLSLKQLLPDSFLGLIVSTTETVLILFILIYCFGINSSERVFMNAKVNNIKSKVFKNLNKE